MLAIFEGMGNPFLEDSGDMLTLDTKVVINKDAIRTVHTIEESSQRQFSEFVEDTMKRASKKPLSGIVSKIKLALFSIPQAKEQVASLKTKCTLFCIACQARQSNLDSFFQHENQACRPFLIWTNCYRDRSQSTVAQW